MERCPAWGKSWWKRDDPSPDAGFILQRGRGEMKKHMCGKFHVKHGHWLLCFIQRPAGRGKRVREVGEAGMKPKKLSAVIMKVEKRSVK